MNKTLAGSVTAHARRCSPFMKSALCRMTLHPAPIASMLVLAITACTSPQPAARAGTEALANCQPSQLVLNLDDGDGRFNGMSHAGTMLILRNIGTSACMVPARPVPGFTDANRQPLRIAAQAPQDMQPALTPSPITVAPGESVEGEMRWVSGDVYDHGHCESPAFITLAIGGGIVSASFVGHLCGPGGKPSTYALKPFQSATAAAKALSMEPPAKWPG